MSGGRDFKLFLASHKSQIGQNESKLVTRLLDGHKPLSYKPIDYEQLATLTQIKRSAGERSRKRVENLLHLNKERKENTLLQDHRRVWSTEWEKLFKLEEKISKEIHSLRPNTPNFNQPTTPAEEIYEEIIDYEDFLHFDLEEFERNTVQPIRDLTEDVKIWVKSHENKKLLHMRTNETNERDIQDTISSIKEQQKNIINQLEFDQIALEKEIDSILHENNFNFIDSKLPSIDTSIPQYLIHLKCPDERLRSSCLKECPDERLRSSCLKECPDDGLRSSYLKEFDELNDKYNGMLIQLEEKYDDVIRKVAWNWSEDDHVRFVNIVNQYAHVARNRRKLFMDRIKREMPEKSLEDVEEYEQWWLRYRTFQSHVRGLCHAWKRDQDDLKLHIRATFADACNEYDQQKKNKVEQMKQKFYCNFLHEKLEEYRKQKDELIKLEVAERMRQTKLLDEQKYRKEMKEQKRREQDKQNIMEYKEKKLRLSALRRKEDLARMHALQENISIQRAHDIERIKFREEKYLEKIEKQRLFKEEEIRQQVEKQERLKKLASTVEVHVEDNPSRLLETTQSLMHRACAMNYDGEQELQRPLFDVYTYNVEQVGSDKRLKIENALRRANLHMSEYARELIAKQPPPTLPRKDTLSSIFE